MTADEAELVACGMPAVLGFGFIEIIQGLYRDYRGYTAVLGLGFGVELGNPNPPN